MDDPKLKAPPIERTTKFLSFDVESNGFHGTAFAVGAVLIQADERILDEFSGRCPIEGKLDPWVEKHVLPPLKAMPENYPSSRALRDGFWEWYLKARARADYTMADNGYPVEARLLIACQEDNLAEREREHPYPLLELNSLFLQAGIKPLAERNRYIADKTKGQKILRHNPRWDAWVSALCAIRALEQTGQLK